MIFTDDEPSDEEKEVVIWYEHISKAGGTTFCGLADSNSKYHIMCISLWHYLIMHYFFSPFYQKGTLINALIL